jgi:integrase
MAVYKRGKTWWFKFTFNGKQFRESTKQTNKRVAEQIEAARKTGLAKGDVGIRDRAPVPTFAEFIKQDFGPHVEANFVDKPSTLAYYRIQLGHLTDYAPLAGAKLNELPSEAIAGFIERQRLAKYEVSSINRALQVLRRAFHLALEWGKVEKLPAKISLVPGKRRRERVLTEDEEIAYLKAAGEIGDSALEAHQKALQGIRATKRGEQPQKPEDPYLLRDVAVILLDCGLRPEECHRLQWEHYRAGDTIYVPYGKTINARREIPFRNGRAKYWSGDAAENRPGYFSGSDRKRAHGTIDPEAAA